MASIVEAASRVPASASPRPAVREAPALSIPATAAWFALVTGLIEVALLAFRQHVLGEVLFLSRHYVWMTPAADLLIYSVPALALLALGRVWPRVVRRSLGIGVFAFLSALGLAFMFPQIHRAAMVLLALGIAVQVVRSTSAHAEGFARLVRRSVLPLALLVVLMAGALGATLQWRERAALAALPPAARGARNVLLVILDTVRSASLSLYGYGRPTTPNLERIARQAIVFDSAFATSPWTLPSHASMFTGRWPHELSTDWLTPLDGSYVTLAEALRERGYLTAGFVGNVMYGSYEFGLDRGFVHYEDYKISLGEVLNCSSLGLLLFSGRIGMSDSFLRRLIDNYEFLGRKHADEINRDFLAWLPARRERPFFAFLNYFDGHYPYTPPDSLSLKLRSLGPDGRVAAGGPRPRQRHGYDLDEYEATIAYMDQQLGALYAQLQRRGVLDDTYVIVVSDHGELIGEHGLDGHGNGLYLKLLHVPLLIVPPRATGTARPRVESVVSLRALPTTILDLLGIRDRRFPGSSLAETWEHGTRADDPAYAEVTRGINVPPTDPVARGPMESVLSGRLHYIRNAAGDERLYDVRPDPEELRDLAARPEHRDAVTRLRGEVEHVLSSTPRRVGRP